ncbi:hypothetical protein Hanom_Chr03g00270791 [Helianthus anomalus]
MKFTGSSLSLSPRLLMVVEADGWRLRMSWWYLGPTNKQKDYFFS